MTDANVLVSAALYRNSVVAEALRHIIDHHTLVVCRYTLFEIMEVFRRKFPNDIAEAKRFLRRIPYEFFDLDGDAPGAYPEIRDPDDAPVIANAVAAEVDVLLTGDKDFEGLRFANLRILSPREYRDLFMNTR